MAQNDENIIKQKHIYVLVTEFVTLKGNLPLSPQEVEVVLEPPLLEEVEEVGCLGVLMEEVVLHVLHLVVVGALDHYPLSDPVCLSLALTSDSEDVVGANAAVFPG